MNAAGRHVQSIFGEALDCASLAEQAAYLNRACGNDAALRARVEALLRAHQQAGPFLQGAPDSADRRPTEAPGTVLGPYQLLEPLGEGGFGVVFRAEQQQPVRRQVALKILKPGMDSRQVIARFEQERQALALMNHPHIARVLDAGEAPVAFVGDSPRPYFVMELVEGVPLTDFCDQNRLTPRERLGLFLSVCQAVQHAHQKGIIHRDLKPSNVLVTRLDGVPVVKVIDFGIAKAIDQRLTDKTLVTGARQVIGTPPYMSPEQAEPGGLDIDTRSDIYALGVLLYELLTGTTPFDKERLHEASFDELRRIIREEEPPRPSTRISTLGPAAATVSGQRRTDPKQLGQLLRGELDWIVMKCLEKDRDRRYETADALARDVARYLADEPVEACPPSAGYRLGKFLRKHRRGLLTAAAFGGLLLAGGVLAGWQVVREARAERDRAVQQARRSQDVQAALSRAAELRGEARLAKAGDLGKWAEARAMARRAEALIETGPVEPGLGEQVDALCRELDQEQKDRQMLAALEDIRLRQADILRGERFDMNGADRRYAEAFRQYGLDLETLPEAEAVRQLRAAAIRDELLAALENWVWCKAPTDPGQARLWTMADGADDNAWRRDLRRAAGSKDGERLLRPAGDARALEQPPAVLVMLGRALQEAGRPEAATDWLRKAQRRHQGDFWLNHHLAHVLVGVLQPPRTDEAVGYFRAAVALRPDSPGAHFNLGSTLRKQGNLGEAAASYRRALDLDARYASAHAGLGIILLRQGDQDGAAAHLRQALDLAPKNATARVALGSVLHLQGDLPGAAACGRQAIADAPTYAEAHNFLGAILDARGDPAGAAACFRQALQHDPKIAMAHFNLGVVLRKQGDLAGAAASFRRATEVQPDYLEAHNELALTLGTEQDKAAAIATYRRLLELRPNDARTHYHLGKLLELQCDFAGAAASFRRAVTLDPDYAEAHCDLGDALIHLGEFREALGPRRTGHELGSQRKGWSHPSAQWVKDCERLIELEGQLPAILKGRAPPAGAAERIELADLCRYKRLYAESVRFFKEAFAADASLAADPQYDHGYSAAGTAALAGCGQGVEAVRLDEADRAALRRQALEWLRGELADRTRRLESGTPQDRQTVREQLHYWQGDVALAGVREAGLLAELPAEERAGWQRLWADVAALQARIRASQQPPASQPPPPR